MRQHLTDIRISRPFLNGCIGIETLYTPEELLRVLHEIEHKLGRKREIHWGPRTLDLDILFYDDLILDTPGSAYSTCRYG